MSARVSVNPLSLRALAEPALLDAEEVKTRAARIVSDRTGLVAFAEIVQTGPSDPVATWVRVAQADTTPIFGVRAYNDGNASAIDVDTALLKSIGESIERYCAASANAADLPLARLRTLDGPGVDPSPGRCSRRRNTRRPTSRWLDTPRTARSAGSGATRSRTIGRSTCRPASRSSRTSRSRARSEIVPWQVSTGLACHTSLTRATLKSLLEVVERDAFMLFWHRRLRCPEIDVSAVSDPKLRSLLERTNVPGYERHILSDRGRPGADHPGGDDQRRRTSRMS